MKIKAWTQQKEKIMRMRRGGEGVTQEGEKGEGRVGGKYTEIQRGNKCIAGDFGFF